MLPDLAPGEHSSAPPLPTTFPGASPSRDIRTRLARINSYLQERLTGMRVVQLFGREAAEGRRFDALNRSHLDANLKSITEK